MHLDGIPEIVTEDECLRSHGQRQKSKAVTAFDLPPPYILPQSYILKYMTVTISSKP